MNEIDPIVFVDSLCLVQAKLFVTYYFSYEGEEFVLLHL
jgi:hypothetical protein